jgi:hypothetical protein
MSRVRAFFGQQREHSPDFLLESLEIGVDYGPPGVEHNRPRRRQNCQVEPDRFSHASPHQVPNYRFSHGSGDGETDLRSIGLFGGPETKGGEKTARVAEALVIDFSEVAAAKNPVGFRKSEFEPRGGDGVNPAWRSGRNARR